MKTNIILNIGLETIQGNPVELHRAVHEIERAGITILASGIVAGEWEGKPEQTLVVQGLAFDSPELRPRIYAASRALSQHCIAIYWNGKGELIGENPNGWEFDKALFHFHCRESAPELSPCQAVQAKHKAKGETLVSGWTRERFCDYLTGTLIPDLKDSGFYATAEDFETAFHFIRFK